jgi:HemY protein
VKRSTRRWPQRAVEESIMIRIFLFLLVVLAIGGGFAWVAERPGDLVLTIADTRYELTLMVATGLLVAIVAAVILTWWVLAGIWNSPHAVRRFFRARKRDRGYQSLSTGMIAAGAGDSIVARRMTKQASGLLSVDQEPLLKLLDAQTALLEGDHQSARAKFEAMLDDKETQVLGLRGLYVEAQRLGEREAARHYAEKASELAPHLGWAGNATMQLKAMEGDWDGALSMLDRQRITRQLEKPEFRRRRAVLLTAKAMAALEANPKVARDAAMEATKLSPELVPAAITAADSLLRLGDLRRGTAILEKNWKTDPHPDVAAAYVRARAGDSVLDRLKRARKLLAMRPNNIESKMAVAEAALAAREFKEAREALDSVIRTKPREGAWLLLADIEEAETGDQGRVRAWLAKAVTAPRDPAWTAGGYVSETWLPFSPITGEIDAFEWKIPIQQIGPVVNAEAADARAGANLPPLMPPPPMHDATPLPEAVLNDEIDVIEAEIIEPDALQAPKEAGTAADDASGHDADADDAVEAAGDTDPQPESKSAAVEIKDTRPLPIPDDPGINPDEPVEKPKRFSLF